MKQHIKKEQIYDMHHFVKQKLFDIMYYGDPPISPENKITIGFMIELLKDDIFSINKGSYFEVMLRDGNTFTEKELCDGLWEATKHKLKRDIKSEIY